MDDGHPYKTTILTSAAAFYEKIGNPEKVSEISILIQKLTPKKS